MFVSDETFVSVDALSNKTHLHETMRKWTVLSTRKSEERGCSLTMI